MKTPTQKRRFTVIASNGNSTSARSLTEAKEICIHLRPGARVVDQAGVVHYIKPNA
jgi:hypothetical protein